MSPMLLSFFYYLPRLHVFSFNLFSLYMHTLLSISIYPTNSQQERFTQRYGLTFQFPFAICNDFSHNLIRYYFLHNVLQLSYYHRERNL